MLGDGIARVSFSNDALQPLSWVVALFNQLFLVTLYYVAISNHLSYTALLTSSMAAPIISERPYYRAFLTICVAVSTCGIAAGRPVLQIGTLRFPYAETIPFPYPLTITLLQSIWTYTCLWFYNFFSKYLHGLEEQGSDSSTNSKVFKSVESLDRTTIVRILPFAFTVAAEATLGNYLLYNMPFEAFLTSRAPILSFLVLLDRYVYGKFNLSRLIYPSIALSICVVMTAFNPPLPHSIHMVFLALLSSVLSALLPLQIQARISSAESSSKDGYIMFGSEGIAAKSSGVDTYSTRTLINQASLLVVIVLVPIVLYSGEPGHILRNCYLLKDSRFWLYMAFGGMFRLIFFTSTILLIEQTSALNWAFYYVFVNVNEIDFFAFDTLRRLQLVGLTAASLSLFWYQKASTDFESNWRSLWVGNRRALLHRTCSIVIPITIMIGSGIFLQIFHGRDTIDSSPPRDREDTGDFPASLFTSMVQGNDSYLGRRPPVNSIVKLQVLIEECAQTENPTARDVYRCLEFLSDNQNVYLSYPNNSVQSRSDEAAPDDISESTDPDEKEELTKTCDGPIIPYHIWWSGLPTWRVELFVKAYLYTQNMQCSKLWIWVDGKHYHHTIDMWYDDPRFKRFMPLVKAGDIIVKEWTLPARVPLPPRDSIDQIDKARYYKAAGRPNSIGDTLVADSVIQDATGQEWLQVHDDDSQISYYDKAISDIARFMIMHMYGGIYLDTDIILLRDIRPLSLSNVSFIKKPDPNEPFGNTIIGLSANSSISSYIVRGGTRMGLLFHAAVLQRMFEKERRDGNDYNPGGLVRLEDAIVDPIWAESHNLRSGKCTVPCLRGPASVFKAELVQNEWESFEGELLGGAAYNRTLENFYRGAFAYHIHGQKKTVYERGSWMDVICSAHDQWFAGIRSNPYGEKWTGPSIAPYRHSS